FRCGLELRNAGFAAPCLPREVAVVVARGSETHRVVVKNTDPRRWDPEAGVVRLKAELRLPTALPRGAYRLALHLADPNPRLRDDGRYAIRLANEDIRFSE